MILSAILSPAPEGGYVALNPETGCTTQGESVPEALANLKEATELYIEEFPIQPTGNCLLTSFEAEVHA
ncbi:MAG: type II toxin-antitoxin system HicB family antitoxin [Verrucomicrobia bacterium]|nr:type II toxin-antitoxin system HicB family antitoxin [Verrucomicrobiota bacterium]